MVSDDYDIDKILKLNSCLLREDLHAEFTSFVQNELKILLYTLLSS